MVFNASAVLTSFEFIVLFSLVWGFFEGKTNRLSIDTYTSEMLGMVMNYVRRKRSEAAPSLRMKFLGLKSVRISELDIQVAPITMIYGMLPSATPSPLRSCIK